MGPSVKFVSRTNGSFSKKNTGQFLFSEKRTNRVGGVRWGLPKGHNFSGFFLEPFPYFPNISQHFQSVLIIVIFSFHSRSRSRPFPGIIASDSRSRISGTFFFIPFPFPNFGNAFFHSLPVPEFWEWIFSFPSRSRILGMEFSIPFPFPNFGNGIFYSRSRSRTLKSHSRSPLDPTFRRDPHLLYTAG